MFGEVRTDRKYTLNKRKLHVLKHKDRVHQILQICSAVISLVTIACIVCYHGFHISLAFKNVIRVAIYGSLFFYILKYFLFLFYSLHPKKFLRKSWFEGSIILLLLLQFISVKIFHFRYKLFDPEDFENYYLLFIQFYFLIIVLLEFVKVGGMMQKFSLSPPTLMALSFLVLILGGTGLLCMPRMTTNGISFIDALFTATSASCITGLAVVSTGTCFTLKGQVVIMCLIQLGGMSILSFATFFTTFLSKQSVGLRYQYMVRDVVSTDRLSDSVSLLRSIVLTTLVIEASGAALLYTYWKTTGFFLNDSQNMFYSLFYTISAFNNGGFVLRDDSILNLGMANNYFPQTIIMVLVFLGGIGFLTIRDFFSVRYIKERNKYQWKKLLPQTKIVLATSLGIIILGTIFFFIVEQNHTLLTQKSLFDKIFASFCQILTSRTSGFTVLNLDEMSQASILFIIVIIFIGGSPCSTAGGIKTTTLFVIYKSIATTLRGKKHIEYDHKTIPFSLVDKANSIFIMSVTLIMTSCILIAIVEPNESFVHAIFETTSAFTTCGLSTGACASWCTVSKVILICNMYIGRLGTLTLGYTLIKRAKESNRQYPDMYLMIG